RRPNASPNTARPNSIELAFEPLASQQPESSSIGQHAPWPPASRHSRPAGHVDGSPTVQSMLQYLSLPDIAHVPESQSSFDVQAVPRPLGPNGCAMHFFKKHVR